MLTQTQTDKVVATVSPLYSDPDFSNVTDLKVTVTSTPPAPVTETDEVLVPKPV